MNFSRWRASIWRRLDELLGTPSRREIRDKSREMLKKLRRIVDPYAARRKKGKLDKLFKPVDELVEDIPGVGSVDLAALGRLKPGSAEFVAAYYPPPEPDLELIVRVGDSVKYKRADGLVVPWD